MQYVGHVYLFFREFTSLVSLHINSPQIYIWYQELRSIKGGFESQFQEKLPCSWKGVSLGTGLIGKRVRNVLQQKTEMVRCFETSIVVGETGSTAQDDGVSTGDEHRRSVAVSYDQIRRSNRVALDVAGEEVVGPRGVEMAVKCPTGCYGTCHDVANNQKGLS
ncbi:hypothetical protein Tco_1157680 [Tanacetum coccineum]